MQYNNHKRKINDYSPLFPELNRRYTSNGKSMSMLQAYCCKKITKEQMNGTELFLTA